MNGQGRQYREFQRRADTRSKPRLAAVCLLSTTQSRGQHTGASRPAPRATAACGLLHKQPVFLTTAASLEKTSLPQSTLPLKEQSCAVTPREDSTGHSGFGQRVLSLSTGTCFEQSLNSPLNLAGSKYFCSWHKKAPLERTFLRRGRFILSTACSILHGPYYTHQTQHFRRRTVSSFLLEMQ